jgi:hypothetical protein
MDSGGKYLYSPDPKLKMFGTVYPKTKDYVTICDFSDADWSRCM